jgi:kumamolisin
VTSVGGTRITAVTWTSPASEIAWQYSSGGPNLYAGMPGWQSAVIGGSVISANGGMRATPDVAAVADPQYSAVGTYYKNAWSMAGGTSVAAPVWAGIGALFGQYLVNKGESLATLTSTTPGGFNGLLYQSKTTGGATAGFYDVISGSNNLTAATCGICTALTGYDDVTGWGAPNVTALFSNF